MDVVAHLQRIADRTGDKILHETARKAHSACAKGVSDAPGGMFIFFFNFVLSKLTFFFQFTWSELHQNKLQNL